ncbi:MAG: helix-turn-helix transcriptional regulator [Undibacterium sp.]|nr:helix-turn-helix transcriptional regulator [Undibacterium sp.]
MEQFATHLREAREARKMTQARLSELLEVDRRVYNHWERGTSVPQLDTVVRLSQVLQLSVDSLVGLEAAKEEPLVHNPRLHALCLQVDSLSDEDQQALIILMDSLINRAQMSKLLAVRA